MQITIHRIDATDLLLEVELSDTIENVRQKISDVLGPTPPYQLVYHGQSLDLGRVLADYNVQRNDTLLMLTSGGVVSYEDLGIEVGAGSGAQLSYLGDTNTLSQTVGGIHAGASYQFALAIRGAIDWSITFHDSDDASAGTVSGAATGIAGSLTSWSTVVTAPAAAVSATVQIKSTTALALIDDVSFTEV